MIIDPPNGYHILEQDPFFSCGYFLLDASYEITLVFGNGFTALHCWDAAHDHLLFNGHEAECTTRFTNQFVLCGGLNQNSLGEASVMAHPDTVPDKLLNEYGLETHDGPVWDGFFDDEGRKIYRLVNRPHSMNIRVKYDDGF